MTERRPVRVIVDTLVLKGFPASVSGNASDNLRSAVSSALAGLKAPHATNVTIPLVSLVVPRGREKSLPADAGEAVSTAVQRILNGHRP